MIIVALQSVFLCGMSMEEADESKTEVMDYMKKILML